MRQPYQRTCRSYRLVSTAGMAVRVSHLTSYCSHTLSYPDTRTTPLSRVALTPTLPCGVTERCSLRELESANS